jgi:hypothetical protein
MSFTTKLKDGIVKSTNAYLAANGDPASHQSYADIEYLDGIPVLTPLYSFAVELRKRMPGIKFGVVEGHTHLYDTVWAMLDDEPYALGMIGWVVNRRAGEEILARRFVVHSETITVKRGKPHTKCTTDLKAAVKLGCTYLRKMPPPKAALKTVRPYVVNVMSYVDKLRDKNPAVAGMMGAYDPAMLAELEALHDSGYQFVNPQVGSKVAAYVQAVRAINAYKSKIKSASVACVFVASRGDGQTFTVIDVTVCTGVYDPSNLRAEVAQTHTTYTTDTLPEPLMGGLSVLSMLKDGEYAAGVGMRVSETVYFVEVYA